MRSRVLDDGSLYEALRPNLILSYLAPGRVESNDDETPSPPTLVDDGREFFQGYHILDVRGTMRLPPLPRALRDDAPHPALEVLRVVLHWRPFHDARRRNDVERRIVRVPEKYSAGTGSARRCRAGLRTR